MRARRLIMLSLAALAGCENPPPITNPPPPGLTVRVEKGNQAEAEARARQYCAQYGKRAVPGSVNRSANETLLSYSCD